MPSRNATIRRAKDREQAREDALSDAELRTHRLDRDSPYRRTIDLAELLEFSQPGTYRLRLYYTNEWLIDRDTGSWVGTRSGPVMTVRILP